MNTYVWNETLEERRVTYTQELAGRLIVIENVPARVCRETGETLFSPETVDRLQAIIRAQVAPVRVLETPVYEFEMANAAAR
jgi:YgiT-type zinc finger domain-containing protein